MIQITLELSLTEQILVHLINKWGKIDHKLKRFGSYVVEYSVDLLPTRSRTITRHTVFINKTKGNWVGVNPHSILVVDDYHKNGLDELSLANFDTDRIGLLELNLILEKIKEI
jgi:hypothetical protein